MCWHFPIALYFAHIPPTHPLSLSAASLSIPNVGKPQFGFWEEEDEKRENTENWGQTCPVITKLYQHTHTHTLIGAWGVD